MIGPTTVNRFRLTDLPEQDRLAALHDIYAPVLNVSIDPIRGEANLAAEHIALPGLSVMHGYNSPAVISRRDLGREDDDFELVWSAGSESNTIRHLGHDVDVADGGAVLASSCDPYSATMHEGLHPVILRVQRSRVQPLLPHAEAMFMRPISADHAPFALLRSYLRLLRNQPPESPELAAAMVNHICDLLALTVGTTRDAAAFAEERGVRAARYAAARHWVSEHLTDPGLSVGACAAAQRVSPRYVQRLFEEHNTTFSHYVLAERLALSRRALSNPLLASRTIAQIAFDAGFGDLSHFNRTFRARFGETPSDARQC